MMKSSDQGSGIRDQETLRMEILLKNAMVAVGDRREPERDLWPAILRRVDQESGPGVNGVPWFDWALAGGLVAFVAMAPRTIPVILYYL